MELVEKFVIFGILEKLELRGDNDGRNTAIG